MPHRFSVSPVDSNSTFWPEGKYRPASRSHWFRLFPISLLLFGLLLVPEQLTAQDPPANLPPNFVPQAEPADEVQETSAALLKKKRQSLVLAAMLLAGVLTLLLLLFLWMLWWSRRTRKLLRQPLPSSGRGDELWYLKAKQDVREATERLSVIERSTPPPQPSREP